MLKKREGIIKLKLASFGLRKVNVLLQANKKIHRQFNTY